MKPLIKTWFRLTIFNQALIHLTKLGCWMTGVLSYCPLSLWQRGKGWICPPKKHLFKCGVVCTDRLCSHLLPPCGCLVLLQCLCCYFSLACIKRSLLTWLPTYSRTYCSSKWWCAFYSLCPIEKRYISVHENWLHMTNSRKKTYCKNKLRPHLYKGQQ